MNRQNLLMTVAGLTMFGAVIYLSIEPTIPCAIPVQAAVAPPPQLDDQGPLPVTPEHIETPAVAPAEPVRPIGDRAGDGLAEVSLRLSQTSILADADVVYGLIEVTANTMQWAQRLSVPVDMTVLIDRSGSMRFDDRLVSARRATLELLDGLRDGDRLTVVSFNDVSHVDVDGFVVGADDTDVRRAISQIRGSGGSCIQCGLATAQERYQPQQQGRYQRRVLLLSDGEGNTSNAELVRSARRLSTLHHAPITTIGFGQDTDRETMQVIAEAGAGPHYYSRDGTELSSILAAEIESLRDTLLADVALEIRTDAHLNPLPGLGAIQHDSLAYVQLGQLRAGETRQVLVPVRPNPFTGLPTAANMNVVLVYRSVDGAQQRLTVDATALYTHDAQIALASSDGDVAALVSWWESDQAITEAIHAIQRGERAQAEVILQDNAARWRRCHSGGRTEAQLSLVLAAADESDAFLTGLQVVQAHSPEERDLLVRASARVLNRRRGSSVDPTERFNQVVFYHLSPE